MRQKLKNKLIHAYLKIMFFALPRLIKATVRSVEEARLEAEKIPQNTSFSMSVMQDYKGFAISFKERGFVEIIQPNIFKKSKFSSEQLKNYDVNIKFKHASLAFLVLSFQEGSAEAFTKNRMIADGHIMHTMILIRILNILEACVLPKFIAKRILKAYPQNLTFMAKIKNASKIIFHFLRFSLGRK